MDRVKLFLALFALWALFIHERTVTHGDGVVAPAEPVQSRTDIAPFVWRGYTVTPLKNFSIEARILSKERYRFDSGAAISPIDLVLGWGRMSDEKVLGEIDISQGGRWYRWQTDHFPIPRREIETHSANMHMIPADDTVRNTLLSLHVGEVVTLNGYLVEVNGKNGYYWKSSLTRNDTGAHACEVVFVNSIETADD
jgi:hypothetical protein